MSISFTVGISGFVFRYVVHTIVVNTPVTSLFTSFTKYGKYDGFPKLSKSLDKELFELTLFFKDTAKTMEWNMYINEL